MTSASSEYMLWAKTRQGARFNLAVSGVPAVGWHDLGAAPEALELTGPSGDGWAPLRAALARHLGVASDRVVQAVGTSLANHLAMAACVEPGDEILVEHPTYELLLSTARYLRVGIRRFPRRPELGFQPDLEALRDALTPRTRLVVLTNLHNPSSARVPDATLREIAAAAAAVGARVLVDEVYLEAAEDPPPVTAHRLGDSLVATASLTKVHGLPGLRCGWVVADPGLATRLWRLNDLFGVNAVHAAERLSLVALERIESLRARSRALLAANRLLWNEFLMGRDDLEGAPLAAGTVAFPRLRRGGVDLLCERLRHRYETTVVPGRFFEMPDHFRVGLGSGTGDFAEGLRRLGQALDELGRCR